MCNFSRKLAAWQPYLRTRLLAPGQGYAEESCQIFVGILPKTSDHSLETLEEIKDGCEHRFATACNVVTV